MRVSTGARELPRPDEVQTEHRTWTLGLDAAVRLQEVSGREEVDYDRGQDRQVGEHWIRMVHGALISFECSTF